MLGVSRRTIYNRMRSGQLQTVADRSEARLFAARAVDSLRALGELA